MAPSKPDVIDLLSSDDEENTSPNNYKRRAVTFSSIKKRVKRENGKEVVCLDLSDSEDDDDDSMAAARAPAAACLNPSLSTISQALNDDDDIAEVAPPAAPSMMNRGKSDKSGQDDDDEEDVAVVGATGPNALADFPHSRENCVTHPHAQDAARRCPNCYCYVCDTLASSCPVWQTHCHATHGNSKWRKMREEVRKNGGVTAPAPPVPRPRAMTMTTVTNPPPPPPLNVAGRPDLDEYSLRALLEAVTSVHPVEVSPPAGVFTTELRHYQKQSVAFMLEQERRTVPSGKTRGGWLCDELGMGKSAVVLALIAANPLPAGECPTSKQIRDQSRYGQLQQGSSKPANSQSKIKVKTTVIMTSVSLIGQWEDECRKHAPGLKVGRYHPSSKSRISSADLYHLDVVISTSTFKWDKQITGNFEFHRVVVDESHLFATAPSSAKIEMAMAVVSDLKWCVTATPCVSSVSQMRHQLNFLSGGFESKKFYLHDVIYNTMNRFHPLSKDHHQKVAFYTLVDVLKSCMIRHTKSQRIQGSEALALPASTTSTVYLDMRAHELNWFGCAHVSIGALQAMSRLGAKTLTLEKSLGFRMKEIPPEHSAHLTKINALVEDLRQLRRVEPAFRVVVFTQSLCMHKFVVKALQHEGLNTFEFSGSTAATKRDKAIRNFQSETDTRPAVFVITLRSGNVGITLTAASAVYLIEPSLDPSAEVQAAGRIHRLGQTKAVQVKKLVFRNSIESNIVDLHKEIAAGRITVSDGFFPPEAVKILVKNIRTKY